VKIPTGGRVEVLLLKRLDATTWETLVGGPGVRVGTRLRVEHEDNANSMGAAAGRSMAGKGTPYTHLPFFYSDLFQLGYEAVGELDPRLEVESEWKEPFREGVVYYLKDGRVRGVLLWNTWGQVENARGLIGKAGHLVG